ncbi:MAG: ArgE/DapE family deacylase [Blastocatellia bacterium]|nr:ArgE/DapE family deacylase [Blastocatellia bacterium]
MIDSTIKLLTELVAIDSVNPQLAPGGAGEGEIAEAVAARMRSAGIDVEITEVLPGRPNVVGVIEGRAQGPSLMFCGHLDTVGVIGMESPFTPVEREGRLYGRGAQDMKGGVAAMVDAACALAKSGWPKRGRLIVAAVIDEEYESAGAEAIAARWKADAAVVTEPTDMTVAIGHKGFSWVEVTTRGRAAHGSRPREGRDAILRMGRVLSRLESLDRDLQSREPHPVHGTASLHASLIEGGRELSTYPDSCCLKIERRTVGGEAIHTALAEVEEILDALKAEDPEFEAQARFMFGRPSYEIASEHELPRNLEAIVRRAGRETRLAGMTYWTDAAILGEAGIPSVVFGPGGAGLHGLEEYVLIDEVIACRDALLELARDYCA